MESAHQYFIDRVVELWFKKYNRSRNNILQIEYVGILFREDETHLLLLDFLEHTTVNPITNEPSDPHWIYREEKTFLKENVLDAIPLILTPQEYLDTIKGRLFRKLKVESPSGMMPSSFKYFEYPR